MVIVIIIFSVVAQLSFGIKRVADVTLTLLIPVDIIEGAVRTGVFVAAN